MPEPDFLPVAFWPLMWRVSTTVAACVVLSIAIAIAYRGRGAQSSAGGTANAATLIPRSGVWIVAAYLLLACNALGAMVLGLLLAIIAAQTVRELLRALAVAGASTDPVPIMTACAIMIVGSAGVGGAQPGLFVTVALLGIAVYGIARVAPLPGFIVWVLTAAGVVVYVGAPLAALVLIRVEAEGFGLLAWTLLIIALTDVAAMFGGVLFGRTQIVPRISASKTLEGTLAGLAGALVGAALVRFALPAATTAVYYGSATLVAAAAFAGDLFASAIKRAAGIKEFGATLPGHGGILDRVDSLLFGAPVAYALAPLLRS